MATFTKLKPQDVTIGRERSAIEARKPYLEALKASDAGQIILERGEVASTVKRRLADAAAELGVKVRSSWTDANQRTLVWKKSAKRAAAPARARAAAPRKRAAKK
jgi:predicted RNA-binding protein YlqC (UPF0109 family)